MANLDALSGTACNEGSPQAGEVKLSFDPSNGAVSITWVPSTLYTQSVAIPTGDGNDGVVSNPAGIDCTPSTPATSVCSAQFPTGFKVTLTPVPDAANQDALTGWSGGGCPPVNSSDPSTWPCTVTMSADTNAAANFAGGLRVESSQVTTHVNVNGKDIGTADPSSPVANLVIAYGATVEILAQQNVTSIGTACNVGSDPTAVVTATKFSIIAPAPMHEVTGVSLLPPPLAMRG